MSISFGCPHYPIFELPKPEKKLPKTAINGKNWLIDLLFSLRFICQKNRHKWKKLADRSAFQPKVHLSIVGPGANFVLPVPGRAPSVPCA